MRRDADGRRPVFDGGGKLRSASDRFATFRQFDLSLRFGESADRFEGEAEPHRQLIAHVENASGERSGDLNFSFLLARVRLLHRKNGRRRNDYGQPIVKGMASRHRQQA